MRYLLIFFTATFYGQTLHHQMLSSQGTSKKLPDGIVVNQSIGQQSLIGTSSNNYVVMQGFQQSFWGKYISSTKFDDIKATGFPNPFVQTVSFELSKPILDLISVNVFDLGGHLLFEEKKKASNNILTIELPLLPTGEYLVRLTAPNFNFYTKIIKL